MPAKEESSVTDHTIKIGGQTIPYKATAATILLKNEKDEPTALIYYTAYIRTDVKDLRSAPSRLSTTAARAPRPFGCTWAPSGRAASSPPTPMPRRRRPTSWPRTPALLLDKTDMVFIDPVGTGFSHAVGKAQDKDFWGVDQDVKSLAQFINIYVNRNNRWNSPKFLIGESYGTFRSAALAIICKRTTACTSTASI